MKCPSCGAEINSTKGVCDYCGTRVFDVPESKPETLDPNKPVCPRCGGRAISFSREKQGEITAKDGVTFLHATVGVCKDCGYTWKTDEDEQPKKKRRTWLWVLGWLFIFPLPLTILLHRKKNMNSFLKAVIIVFAWLFYLALGTTDFSSAAPLCSFFVFTERNERYLG